MKVKKITKTCDACPSQWDIELIDGTTKYGRLRHGWLYFGQPGEVEWETSEGDLGGFMWTKDVIPYLRKAGYEVDDDVEIVDPYV